MELPPGYERHEVGGAHVVARADLAPALLAAGVADPDALVARAPLALGGRGRLARVALEGGAALVRPVRRGGLLGKLVARLSLDPERALRELVVSAHARARGAAVLDVLAAVTTPRGLGVWHAVVSREVEGARDLARLLAARPAPAARRAALLAAGRAVRALHDVGVDHVDLNLANVLVRPGAGPVDPGAAGARPEGGGPVGLRPEAGALVIDLDRCVARDGPVPDAVRRRNLLRLLRSWVKLGARDPDAVRARDPWRFLRGYAPGDRALARALLRAVGPRPFPCRRALWLLSAAGGTGAGREATAGGGDAR